MNTIGPNDKKYVGSYNQNYANEYREKKINQVKYMIIFNH